MDKYDEQIQKLTSLDEKERRQNIRDDWLNGTGIFQFCTPEGKNTPYNNGYLSEAGCLTMVHSWGYFVYDSEGVNSKLTEQIKLDPRFCDIGNVKTKDQLEVFAEWQRRLDKEIRNIGVLTNV